MKRLTVVAVALTFTLCAAALIAFMPDAVASPLIDPVHIGDPLARLGEIILANPALVALRTQHADLTRKAEAKLAEVRDGLPAEQVRQIEADHAELVRQATEVQTRITEAERANPDPAPQPQPNEAAVRAAAEQAVTAERQRVADIGDACRAFGVPDLATDMIRRGITIEAARAEIQAKLAERSRANPQQPHITVTRDEGDTIRRAVESAILLRANPQALAAAAPEREMARNWRGMTLMEAGRSYLEETRGVRLRGLSRMELASVLLGLDGTRAGMQSTSDFANLLANVASKRLRDAYAVAPQNWKKIARQSNNPDFKEKSVVQLSSGPSFKKVRESAEFTYGALTDGVEKYALATYGRIIAITRQALINDDLNAFDRLPTMLGRQAAELEASIAWLSITANPKMGDGADLFHADHGNLGSASAIDETNLALAKAAMRKQKSLAAKAADREPLNLVPAYLVVSPDKEVQAQKMLTAVLATSTGDVNVFSNSMQLIVEPRLTGNSWYLIADPAVIDTIEYSYLEGEEGVFIEQRVGFEVDGLEIKGRLDFAAKAIDWRGMYYNPGA